MGHPSTLNQQAIIPPPPVHPLSSLATIAIDLIWGMVEIAATLSIAALLALLPLILTCGAVCFIAVTLVQHYVAHDNWRESIAKGFVMGIIAAVPYSVAGTSVGVILLGWAGIHGFEKKIRNLLTS